MNQQDLNFVRIELRRALPDLSEGTKGQLEAFSEHPPADKNATPRRGIHLVELEERRGLDLLTRWPRHCMCWKRAAAAGQCRRLKMRNFSPRRGVGQFLRLVDTSRLGCGTATALT